MLGTWADPLSARRQPTYSFLLVLFHQSLQQSPLVFLPLPPHYTLYFVGTLRSSQARGPIMEESGSRNDLRALMARCAIKSQVLGDWFFAPPFGSHLAYHANSVREGKNVLVVSMIEHGDRCLVRSPGAQAVVAVEQFLA